MWRRACRDAIRRQSEYYIFLIIPVGLLQTALNVFIIVFCLFNFILSLRLITRLSILISGNPKQFSMGPIGGTTLAKKTLISAQNHWMIGVRMLFYLVATLLWLLHPFFFVTASILITIYLIYFQDFWLFKKKK